jgi:hypothetical protein
MKKMRFTQAFLQESGKNELQIECQLLKQFLTEQSIPITYFNEKNISRGRVSIDLNSLVVGDIPCMQHAMKQLKIKIPIVNSYPKSLNQFLNRKIWLSTFGDLITQFQNGLRQPLFAKPFDKNKKFTGRVFNSEADLQSISNISKSTKLICSEVVKWVSEFRVYVVNSEIREIANYDGDKNIKPDFKKIKIAINTLDDAGESYAGYGIDFGVLITGETALIEINDGYGLGAYEITYKNYGDLVVARWEELLSKSSS